MDKHIQEFMNKLSYITLTIATITFLFVVLQTPETCIPSNSASKSHLKFPKSTCDSSPRRFILLDKKNKKLWSSKSWQTKVSSYEKLFQDAQVIANDSKVLCISAGAGHEVMAVSNLGAKDVTGVELVDSFPLVSRADPHNLPFFDDVFDVAFSGNFEYALYSDRFASEMERTVKVGGVCILVVNECSNQEADKIVSMFKRSSMVNFVNVSLSGLRMTRIVMRVVEQSGSTTNS